MLIAALIAGVYLLFRDDSPTRVSKFSSLATLFVASNAEDAALPAPENLPHRLLVSQSALALSRPVTVMALRNAGRPPTDPVSFRVVATENGEMKFTVIATQRNVAENVAAKWVDVFVDARRKITLEDLENRQGSVKSAISKTRNRINAVTREIASLTPIPPVVDFTPGEEEQSGNNETELTPTLEGVNEQIGLLAYEKAGLVNELESALKGYGEITASLATPSPYTQMGFQGSPRVVLGPSAKSTLQVPGMLLLFGLLIGLAAAVVFDRFDRTIRSANEAQVALDVPVLATIPLARRQEVVVLTDPGSERSEAYRNLAATCVATERLPSAIMVTTPQGDACDDVAVNFAAALANLGVKVALVATSPDQAWFQEAFPPSPEGTPTFPELLAQAHAGQMNGQLRRLVVSNATPNLLLVPPGSDPDEELSLDGLRPLLEELAAEGIELTVVAGPALLDNADATIVAWTTRTVLWAVGAGEVRQSAAAEAAARLELTGVTAFGATVVGGEA